MKPKTVTIYTDGGCIGNPGPGGYGVVLMSDDHRKELSGGFRLTTNNRMELLAAIEGLKALKYKCKVSFFSDSKYLVDAFNEGWIYNWEKRNWRKSDKKEVLNLDLWKALLELANKHDVTWHWVKGHSGNEENERCDKLAVEAANKEKLPPDIIYEKENLNL